MSIRALAWARQPKVRSADGPDCSKRFAASVLKGVSILKKLGYLLLGAIATLWAADTQTNPPASSATTQKHWAYQPVKRPDVPQVQQKEWVRTQIDAFLLAKQEAKGLKASPDAVRPTFIRRATLDVWGVIP